MSPSRRRPSAILILVLLLLGFAALLSVRADSYDFPQIGFVGTWESVNTREETKLKITGGLGQPYTLELTTLSGTYKNWTFKPPYEAAKGEIKFVRSPKADEMDASLLEAARKAAEGQAQWLLVLTVDAHSSPCNVRLGGTFYSGKVEYGLDPTGRIVPGTLKVTPGTVSKENDGQLKRGLAQHEKVPRALPVNLKLEKGTTGKQPDLRELALMIEDCRTRSGAFNTLIEERQGKTSPVTLQLGRGTDVGVDAFRPGTSERSEINPDHLQGFPCRAFDGNRKGDARWYYPDPAVPNWACSRCEILAHIIAEASCAANQHLTKTLADHCHQEGLTRQSTVREGFGLPHSTKPTQTLMKDGTIEIKYGTDYEKEILKFSNGGMDIEYAKKK